MPTVITPCGGGSGGSGIQFDTYPQAGDWLYAQTNNATGSPDGFGIELNDFSTGGAFIGTFGGGDLTLQARGGGELVLRSFRGILISEENGGASTDITINSTFRDLYLFAKRTVSLNANGAAPVELRADGTYHIKTGAVWIDDL